MRYFWSFFAIFALGSGIHIFLRRRVVFGWLAILLALAGMAISITADRRNMCVEYNEWLSRGMPEWGAPLISPK